MLRSSLRHLGRHPWIALLSILGVTLGVAVVVSIHLTGRSAQLSFERSTDTVAGRATHKIAGGPRGVPEKVYTDLRRQGVRNSAPLIEGSVTVEGDNPATLKLLGIDPLAEGAFRSYSGAGMGSRSLLVDFLGGRPVALLSEATARRLGVAEGESMTIQAGTRRTTLRITGLLHAEDPLQTAGLENLLLVDVSLAQAALGLEGRLTRIDLRIPESATSNQELTRIEALLGPGLRLERSASRTETAAELTRAFRINLQALSMLALLCGAFLIYNSVTFSVVLRRRLFATLRALGTTRRRILRMVFTEALLIGFLGSVFGVAAGVLLARLMVGMVAQTVTDFYFNAGAGQVAIEPLGLLGGVALGTLAAGLAGLRPSWEATTVSPRQALLRSSLESDSHRAARVGAVVAVAAVAAGVALLLASRSIVASFIGVFVVLLGFSLATPLVALATARGLGALFGSKLGMTGRMAIRSIGSHLSRTGVAMAALMMALAVAVGIGLMITSFRSTVERWLQASLPADLYITTATGGAQDAVPVDLIPESLLEKIADLPGVDGVNALRRASVHSSAGELTVVALDMDARSHDAFPFKGNAIAGAWEGFHRGETVLVSEPLASRTNLSVNDLLDLKAPGAAEPLPVGGVFYDYSTDRGYLLMSLDLYRRLWNDPGITAASVFVHAEASLEEVAAEVRRALPVGSGLVVRSDAVLRTESLQVFDRTFQITGVLRGLAIIVAMIGILGSLMALQLERTRELGLLRATGLTRAQLWKLVTAQTGLIGLISGLLALPVGAAMAAMMIYVVNRRSFGWTMPMEVDPLLLIQTVAMAVFAAVIAGALPSRRMANVSPAEALREE